ncbi:unnamed protein product [Lampetra planeri]
MFSLGLLKKTVVALTLLVMLLYVLDILRQVHNNSKLVITSMNDVLQQLSTGIDAGPDPVFHKVGQTQALAFSAYLDVRDEGRPFVRVFVLAPRDINYNHFTCQLFYRDPPTVMNVSAKEDRISSHFGFRYGVYNFLCNVPDRTPYPSHVSLTDKASDSAEPFLPSIPVVAPGDSVARYDFAVCLPTLFGAFNNSLILVQNLEMYRILGAGIVTVYNTSVSPTVNRILTHYSRVGFLEVVQWPIENYLNPSKGWRPDIHPGELHYYGQIATMNDCLYRNMYRAKYISFADADEVILPRQWSNWADMMRAIDVHQSTSAFYFTLHTFPITNEATWTSPLGGQASGTDILNQTAKQIPPSDTKDATTKILGCPKGLVYVSVNTVLVSRPGYRVHTVPDAEGTLQHYKRWKKEWQLPDSSVLMRDFHVQNIFGSLLRDRVLKSLDELRESSASE